MKIWAISDLHTEYPSNLTWIENLSPTAYQSDAIIVAGDISDRLAKVEETLELFKERWAHVFFCVGNHELWCRPGEDQVTNSVDKVAAVHDLCHSLGVHYKPKQLDGVWIVPLISWYHAAFDTEPDVPKAQDISQSMADFRKCKWPEGLQQEEVAGYMDKMNDEPLSQIAAQLEGSDLPVITFSHFVPRQDLLPEKRMLFQPNLAKAVGSNFLEPRIRKLRPVAHVFGHTHFLWDAEIDGVRYCQAPLAYPRERQHRSAGQDWLPLMLYDTATGPSSPKSAHWSDYYKHAKREPSNVTPAPWVKL
ncbi:hypothetical protein WJX73_005589 [Symbiochloris irregularis]|uniref:Calcineurin-like phosphoesterase domain-containing protein n=1 Tax=Symbiochloris irregularis TaxID=706552 RepID=A0AAW1P4K2_9CHLO